MILFNFSVDWCPTIQASEFISAETYLSKLTFENEVYFKSRDKNLYNSLLSNRGKQIVYHEILGKKIRRNKENSNFPRLLNNL